jgi:hypothetical protein
MRLEQLIEARSLTPVLVEGEQVDASLDSLLPPPLPQSAHEVFFGIH